MPKAKEEREAKRSPNWQDKLQALTKQRLERSAEGSPPFEGGAKTLGFREMQSRERMHGEEMNVRRQQMASQERQHMASLTAQQRQHAERLAFDRAVQQQRDALAWAEFQLAASAQEESAQLRRDQFGLEVDQWNWQRDRQNELLHGFDDAFHASGSSQPDTQDYFPEEYDRIYGSGRGAEPAPSPEPQGRSAGAGDIFNRSKITGMLMPGFGR